MASLPHGLYDVDAVRRIDAAAIEQLGIPGLTLMQRAGAAVWDEIQRRWPVARNIVVLAGAGNNAGDGYVIARLAHAADCTVTVIQIGDPGGLGADAAACLEQMRAAGCVESACEGRLPPADLYVDAMLGTGETRPVAAPYTDVIRFLNERGDTPV
ncbi:MAG: NAD(P)H-hydrate epimerase, partial [Gammaproteobacteria bacterium]|nr:NAD(P)H-hydrate epimerase [Gammaproteobacteria bacterium]